MSTRCRSTVRAEAFRALLACGALAAMGLLPVGVRAEASAVPATALDRLAWLAGCWAAEGGEPGSGETWTPPAGGTMFGIGRTVKRGRTVEHEFVQVRLDAEGRPVYVAKPSNQPEASFVATEVGDGSVVFENPAHDFPQRIAYRRLLEGRMVARIEGLRRGAPRAIDFPLRRIACP